LQPNEHRVAYEARNSSTHINRLASVGQIAAGIAHEVRNPLTAVKGFLQLLQEQAPHPYLEIAHSELDNAITTLQNLLNVSKPDMDDEPVQDINLSVELESLLQLFQDQVYRIRIQKLFKDTDTVIFGKRNQIKRALFNLLKNAFEAIPGEGIIEVEHYKVGSNLILIISDTGIGIKKEKLELIGTPFFSTKVDGTGMGLTQVFSTFYQHGAIIDVDSVEGQGTSFRITFRLDNYRREAGFPQLNLIIEKDKGLKEFFEVNKNRWNDILLSEAVNVKDSIKTINQDLNIDLIQNSHKLVMLLLEKQEHEIIRFACEEGRIWAQNSLTLALKLEWLQAIRNSIWAFLYHYYKNSDEIPGQEQFFELERHINGSLDIFLRHFFMTYTQYKDQLLQSHRDMIDDLSVPVIPLSPTLSILPLVGMIDTYRTQKIQMKVLEQIGAKKIMKLIIDLSGVAYMDTAVVTHIFKIIDGIRIMGCEAVVTGIRPEIANTMINMGITFTEKVETKGSLAQALAEYGFKA